MDPNRWWTEIHDIHEFRSTHLPDEAIARIASRSGGVVDRAQLAALGLTRGAIDHRIRVGRLRRFHHGVYAVGHEAIQVRGRLVAGLMAAGPGAALSHRTAAALWKLIPSLPPFVEVTTTTTARAPQSPGPQLPPRQDPRRHHPPRPPHHAPRSAPCSTSPRPSPSPTSSALAARRSSSPASPPRSSRNSRGAARPCSPASPATESPRPAQSSSAVSSRRC